MKKFLFIIASVILALIPYFYTMYTLFTIFEEKLDSYYQIDAFDFKE